MTVVLELKPETEEALQKKAQANGFEINVYLEKLVEKDIAESEKTFDEILAPIRQGFQSSGLSEDEWLELFEAEREAMWQEQQASK